MCRCITRMSAIDRRLAVTAGKDVLMFNFLFWRVKLPCLNLYQVNMIMAYIKDWLC